MPEYLITERDRYAVRTALKADLRHLPKEQRVLVLELLYNQWLANVKASNEARREQARAPEPIDTANPSA